VVFGVVLTTFPAAGILAITWLIGAYAVAFGVLMVALGISLKTAAT
jgi:uncharacterized membrane protein HdeD (DUF308 family)